MKRALVSGDITTADNNHANMTKGHSSRTANTTYVVNTTELR